MKKQFIITVNEKDSILEIDRENKGFSPLELLGLIASEYQKLQHDLFHKSKPLEKKKS